MLEHSDFISLIIIIGKEFMCVYINKSNLNFIIIEGIVDMVQKHL